MQAFVGLATAAWLGVVAFYLYTGWRRGEPLLSGTTAYGVARAESRAGSHLDRGPECGCDGDDAVRCLRCGAANESGFSFCRQCETPLC